MLNWEKNNRHRKTREYSSDMLPDTGSWQDRIRWENESGIRSSYPTRRPTVHLSPIDQQVELCVKQLKLYVQCVNSAYFQKKPKDHQNEILVNLKILINKVQVFNCKTNHEVEALLKQAKSCLSFKLN